jgi:hypothetical protein
VTVERDQLRPKLATAINKRTDEFDLATLTDMGRTKGTDFPIRRVSISYERTDAGWDIDTVPDLRAAARMLNMESAADEVVRTAMLCPKQLNEFSNFPWPKLPRNYEPVVHFAR